MSDHLNYSAQEIHTIALSLRGELRPFSGWLLAWDGMADTFPAQFANVLGAAEFAKRFGLEQHVTFSRMPGNFSDYAQVRVSIVEYVRKALPLFAYLDVVGRCENIVSMEHYPSGAGDVVGGFVLYVTFRNGYGASIARNRWSYGGECLAVVDRDGSIMARVEGVPSVSGENELRLCAEDVPAVFAEIAAL
jgi:hypothetical protein